MCVTVLVMTFFGVHSRPYRICCGWWVGCACKVHVPGASTVDTIWNEQFAPYSEVSLTQGPPVYFLRHVSS